MKYCKSASLFLFCAFFIVHGGYIYASKQEKDYDICIPETQSVIHALCEKFLINHKGKDLFVRAEKYSNLSEALEIHKNYNNVPEYSLVVSKSFKNYFKSKGGLQKISQELADLRAKQSNVSSEQSATILKKIDTLEKSGKIMKSKKVEYSELMKTINDRILKNRQMEIHASCSVNSPFISGYIHNCTEEGKNLVKFFKDNTHKLIYITPKDRGKATQPAGADYIIVAKYDGAFPNHHNKGEAEHLKEKYIPMKDIIHFIRINHESCQLDDLFQGLSENEEKYQKIEQDLKRFNNSTINNFLINKSKRSKSNNSRALNDYQSKISNLSINDIEKKRTASVKLKPLDTSFISKSSGIKISKNSKVDKLDQTISELNVSVLSAIHEEHKYNNPDDREERKSSETTHSRQARMKLTTENTLSKFQVLNSENRQNKSRLDPKRESIRNALNSKLKNNSNLSTFNKNINSSKSQIPNRHDTSFLVNENFDQSLNDTKDNVSLEQSIAEIGANNCIQPHPPANKPSFTRKQRSGSKDVTKKNDNTNKEN